MPWQETALTDGNCNIKVAEHPRAVSSLEQLRNVVPCADHLCLTVVPLGGSGKSAKPEP